jgi:hypothetical protein
MVPMRAVFVVLLEGTEAIFKQSNHVHSSSCVFTMFKKIEKPAACEMRSLIRFLNARNMKLADIRRQLCEVYGEHAMNDTVVRSRVRHFNEGREDVHDDQRSGRPSVVNDLVLAIEVRIQENRRFTISSLSLHFPQISHHFFTKLCLKASFSEIVFTLVAEDAYG